MKKEQLQNNRKRNKKIFFAMDSAGADGGKPSLFDLFVNSASGFASDLEDEGESRTATGASGRPSILPPPRPKANLGPIEDSSSRRLHYTGTMNAYERHQRYIHDYVRHHQLFIYLFILLFIHLFCFYSSLFIFVCRCCTMDEGSCPPCPRSPQSRTMTFSSSSTGTCELWMCCHVVLGPGADVVVMMAYYN
jgi:hypothetical protein